MTKDELLALYDSGLSQVGIAANVGVWPSTVSRWMRRYGIALGRGANRFPNTGDRVGTWKGSEASYSAMHKRTKKLRGKPSFCEHCQTITAKRYEWASLSKNYSDVNDYIRLCTSCHRKHDGHSRGPKCSWWKGGPSTVSCYWCKIVFTRHGQKGKPPKFCSLSCCNEWQRAR